jgi:hypothetical protein
VRRPLAVALIAGLIVLLGGVPPRAQTDSVGAVVFVIEGTTFRRFVNRPPVSGVVDFGGIAMLRGPDPSIEAVAALEASGVEVIRVPASGNPQVSVSRELERLDGEVLAVVVGLVPESGPDSEGPDAVLVARGLPVNLLAVHSDLPLSSLTSDSTRRHGVVTPADVVVTLEDAAGVQVAGVDDGSLIRVVATEPPVKLYERYLQYRELSAPIQTGVGIWEVGIGALAVATLRSRRRGLFGPVLGAVLALPVMFLTLLLAGHLPSISYATVVPALVVTTAAGGLVLVRVADRSGIGVALAWAGGIGVGGLVAESLLGWTAAFAPMLGGSHLDGARFFGMPNVEIGLALGGATLVAARIRSILVGAALIGAAGLWFGSPWFGSNLGASVTLFAGAGLWWGLRGERGWLWAGGAAAACTAAGAALVVFAHRVLTDVPTHITRFAEGGLGFADIVGKAIDRLEIGIRLLADQPPAVIPVAGTVVALGVVLVRPPEALRTGFARTPSARASALTILLGSVVAYLANDTGAAALGLGFGMGAVTLFAVSLAAAREKMEP